MNDWHLFANEWPEPGVKVLVGGWAGDKWVEFFWIRPGPEKLLNNQRPYVGAVHKPRFNPLVATHWKPWQSTPPPQESK